LRIFRRKPGQGHTGFSAKTLQKSINTRKERQDMSTLTSIDGPALHGRRSAGKPTAVNDATRPTVLGSGVEPTAALKPVAVKQPAAATTTYCPLTARRTTARRTTARRTTARRTTAEPSTAVALTANARATGTPHRAQPGRSTAQPGRTTAQPGRATAKLHRATGSLHRATGTRHRETPPRNRDARLRRRYGHHQARRVGPGRCCRAAGSKW